jgi:hypothetical protein
VLGEVVNQHKTIEDILKTNLKIEHSVKSIESLFENKRLSKKINYSPYYQRNYVWDKQKASYFIESILIGTEIPPLVFFNNGESIEVIDGRQRFETIRKFIDLEFSLVKSGLDRLSFLNKKNFNDLHPDVKEILRNTKLRIFEFSILNLSNISEYEEDLVKKEIFRRYNSGITPLKKPDLEKAIYIEDDLTNHFKKCFLDDHNLYAKTIRLLLGKRDLDKIDDVYTIERVMSKMRQMLVITDIPIKRLSAKGRSLVEKYYELFSETTTNKKEIFCDFKDTISILEKIYENLKSKDSDLFENYLVYESLYWAIEVIKKEDHFDKKQWDQNFIEKIASLIDANPDHYSMENSLFYKAMNDRYHFVASIFHNEFKMINFNFFLESTHVEFKNETLSAGEIINYVDSINSIRINKPEPSNETIEDVCKKIKRVKFLVRPIYQRREVINRKKSSGLIESILLGIKVPPIFVFKRSDGVSEVVDGQQRLLSIIGFIGEEFMDENGTMMKSNKNLFKLNGLSVLTELNGKKFTELPQKLQDKILDFNLSLVTIDQKINESFDPVDLFIRLNNKPYPIRDNSFEMWNSYIDRDFITSVRENVEKHSDWFYLRDPKQNNRMDNEQCYTILVFLFYKERESLDTDDDIKFYQRGNSLNARLRDKNEITKTLEQISTSVSVKEKINHSIEDVEKLISTLRLVTSLNGSLPEDTLRSELSGLLNLKTGRRTMQSFYILWHVLNKASVSKLKKDTSYTKNKIRDIFSLTKEIQNENGLSLFETEVDQFKEEFFQ